MTLSWDLRAVIDDGNDLCPHSDCCKKLGTHLFFFPHLCWRGSGDFVFLDESNNLNNPRDIDFRDQRVVKYRQLVYLLTLNSSQPVG